MGALLLQKPEERGLYEGKEWSAMSVPQRSGKRWLPKARSLALIPNYREGRFVRLCIQQALVGGVKHMLGVERALPKPASWVYHLRRNTRSCV